MSTILKVLIILSCPLAWASRIESTWEGNADLYVSTSGKTIATYGGVSFSTMPDGNLFMRECWLWEVNQKWKANCFRMAFQRAGNNLSYEGKPAGVIDDESIRIDFVGFGFHLVVDAQVVHDQTVTYRFELNSTKGVRITKSASGLK